MCTFYILTPMNPIILSGCVDLQLAPYNSHYPRIEKHALACGITPNLNKWDKPIVTTHNNQLTASSTGIHWIPLPVDGFNLFTVPLEQIKMNEKPTSNQYVVKNSSVSNLSLFRGLIIIKKKYFFSHILVNCLLNTKQQ